MKNKKLFAILTLLCFLFTLMPVAAFAAEPYVWVEDGEEVVRLDKNDEAEVKLNLSNVEGAEFIVFAMKGDALTNKMTVDSKTGFVTLSGLSKYFKATFTAQGEYTVYAVAAGDYEKAVVAATEGDKASKSLTQAAKELLANSDNLYIMENNVITVNASTTAYQILASVDGTNFYAEDYHNDVDKDGVVDEGEATFDSIIGAALATTSNGYEEKTLWVKLLNDGDAVVGKELTVSTNSYAIDVDKETVTTNPNGVAKIKLSSTIAGDFKVYVEYGSKADLTIDVAADSTDAAYIETVYEPTAPVALDSTISSTEISFSISDINGNNVDDSDMDKLNYVVKVVEAPKGSSVKGNNISLFYNANNAIWLLSGVTLDAEGDYTFKVILDNGASATASVTVKEFQTPVELKMVYKQNTVELNGEAVLNKLFYVDANGVTKSLIDGGKVKEVKLAANGYAVEKFTADTGLVKVEADEKYVGSKITVAAVSQKYNLTAAVELTVANEAAGVKYASAEADVAVNNTLTANIVDEDGNKVALKSGISNVNISYVVLDKPVDAKVAVSTKTAGNLAQKGEFKVSFTASEIGAYELQTIVTYEQANGVVKYYSGVETITVGNTGFEDIVVMSIGSNEIVVNAETKAIDAAPIIENNRTFVPFRALAEAFGSEVAYDEATQAVTAELNDTTVVMTIGSAAYTVNGVEKTADVAPFINGSRTMVPVRFVAEAFGISVTPTYDENGATADILFAK